jgi:hypothetical protein
MTRALTFCVFFEIRLCFLGEMPLIGMVTLVGRAEQEQRARRGITCVTPAVGEMGFEDQAVAWIQDKSLPFHFVADASLEAEYKLNAGMYDGGNPAVSLWL